MLLKTLIEFTEITTLLMELKDIIKVMELTHRTFFTMTCCVLQAGQAVV